MQSPRSPIPPDGLSDQTLSIIRAKDASNQSTELPRVEGLDTRSYPAELDQWVSITTGATMLGFIAGAILGITSGKMESLRYLSVHGRQLPLKEQQRILYKGMAQASSRKAVFWAMNFGVFVGLYTGVQKYLQVRRDRNDFWNSVAGGTAAGALFSLRQGMSAVPRGTLVGAGLGLIAGITADMLNPLFPKEFVKPKRVQLNPISQITEEDLLVVGDNLFAADLKEHERFERWADAIERRALLDKPSTVSENKNQGSLSSGEMNTDFVDRGHKR